MSATVVCRRQKVLKLRRLKRLKNSPKKRNLEQKRSYSRFYNRKSQRQQKLAKKITYLIIPFRSKNLIYFTDLNSPNMFLVDFRKKSLHCIISRRPRTAFSKHWESKCLYILVYLYKKLLSGAGQNNSVKEANYLVLVNFFKVFQLN